MSKEQPFFRVNNYEILGEILEEWARDHQTWPENWSEFIQVLEERGAGPVVPDGFGEPELAFHLLVDGKMNISLPTKTMLDAANIAVGLQKKRYIFPSQYDLAYTGSLDENITPPKRKKVQRARLADYCISLCM